MSLRPSLALIDVSRTYCVNFRLGGDNNILRETHISAIDHLVIMLKYNIDITNKNQIFVFFLIPRLPKIIYILV